MKIKPFLVEEWMNAWETGAKYNIAETCVDSVSLDELFALTGTDKTAFLNDLSARRLTYGYIEGAPAFKEGICRLYRTIDPAHVVTCHGASGANHHIFYSLVDPGDKVISIMPTYQQLYSIPASFGADVKKLPLRKEENFLPDLDELRRLCEGGAKVICLNNPNNPTGALMPEEMLKDIIAIARDAGAYVLCDEVYRHLTQHDEWSPSVADLYEKGISISSMSKVFSLAGLRLGWIACRDDGVIRSSLSHRDYDLVSAGMLDEAIAGLALAHKDALLTRNRAIVRKNLSILDAWMKREPHLSWVKPKAGTTALIYYDFDISSRQFCEDLYHQTGAFVTPGDCFEEETSFRIGYASDEDTLRKGLAAMDAYMKSLER